MAPLVATHQRKDFKGSGFKSRAKWLWNQSEKNIMLQCSLQNWWLVGCEVRVREVREVNKDFSIFFLFAMSSHLFIRCCRAGRATGLEEKATALLCTEKLFSHIQWQERWRPQSFCSECGANGADMDTPLTVKHAATHTILSIWKPLYKDTGGHLKNVECVFLCMRVWMVWIFF